MRERLTAGDSDAQVLDFLTARYGQFVLLKPPFGWDTALLWLAPAGVLLIGVCGFGAVLLRRRRAGSGCLPMRNSLSSRLRNADALPSFSPIAEIPPVAAISN